MGTMRPVISWLSGSRLTVDDKLSHTNEAKDVHVEHRLVVCLRNVTNLFCTEHEASIVNFSNVMKLAMGCTANT
jgi:hypothetical protein